MENWFEVQALPMLQQGKSYSDISLEIGKSYKAIQKAVSRYKLSGGQIDTPQKQKTTYNQDGTIVSEKFIKLKSGQHLSPTELIELHGFNADEWDIVSCTNNFWNSQIKGGATQISYQSKLTLRPKKVALTFKDIENYFSKATFPTIPVSKALNYNDTQDFCEICLPDIHSGLYVWRMETGADYDVHIARDRFYQCVNDIIERCKEKKLKRIVITTLGDLLHIDNDKQETTKGTFQQSDGRIAKIFDATLDMLIYCISICVNIAPVEVKYIAGNHDRVAGYMLLKALEMAFRKDSNITFDTAPNPHKFALYGNVLIGWTHGDIQKQNMPNWLQHQAKKEYGQSKFAEVHAGHFHSQKVLESKRDITQTEEQGGVVIRYLPVISNSSYWEHQQGYTSASKTMMGFIWNEETGLREQWYTNII